MNSAATSSTVLITGLPRPPVVAVTIGRAVALADLGNRGALDVIVANQRGPVLIYRNSVQPGRHWIQFQLEGRAGPTVGSMVSNRSAFGARVELHWNGRKQVQEVVAASGFSAQNQRRLHYGLGAATSVDRVIIRWPSGKTQTIEKPEVDRLHRVKEPEIRLKPDSTGTEIDGR